MVTRPHPDHLETAQELDPSYVEHAIASGVLSPDMLPPEIRPTEPGSKDNVSSADSAEVSLDMGAIELALMSGDRLEWLSKEQRQRVQAYFLGRLSVFDETEKEMREKANHAALMARAVGASWSAIGGSIGITHQSASERWSSANAKNPKNINKSKV